MRLHFGLALTVLLAACTAQPLPTPTTTAPPPTATVPAASSTPRFTATAAATPLPTDTPTPAPSPTVPAPVLEMYRGGPARLGAYDQPPLAAPPEVRWQKSGLGIGVHGAPVVAGGTVYVPTQVGRLRAYDALTGDLLWTFGSPGEIVSSPAVVDDTVYVSRETEFFALDAATGEQRWAFQGEGFIYTAPLYVDGVVYFSEQAGVFHALNADTGEPVWSVEVGGNVLWPLVFAGDRLIAAAGMELVALDPASGGELWRAEQGEWWAPPAAAEGLVYSGNSDGAFYALDAATGETIWLYQTDGTDWSGPAVGGGRVMAGNRDQSIYALDAATGEFLWSFASEDWAVSDPLLAGEVLYVGVGNHDRREGPRRLYALDAATGVEQWTFLADSRLLSAPALGEGVLYLLSTFGTLYALE